MKKKVIFAIVLIAMLALFASCSQGQSETSSGEESETTPAGDDAHEVYVFMADTSSEYSVVYPLIFADEPEAAYRELRSLISENSGGAFAYKSDYMTSSENASSFDGAKEILLGDTNRKETAIAKGGLRENDYVIKVVNAKLVVAGGSNEATAVAIKHFAAMFFSDTRESLVLRDDFEYRHEHEYPVEYVDIDGSPLGDYTILYAEGAQTDALFLSDTIRAKTGYLLDVGQYSEEFSEKAIVIGTSPSSEGYAIRTDGENILIDGADVVSRNYAVALFVDKGLLSEDGSGVDIDTASFGFSGQTVSDNKLSVMSLNVYSTGYAENSVRNRYPRLYSLIGSYVPDVLCLQDVSPTWREFIENGTDTASALTEIYSYVGVGRNNDEDSVMQAIFYKKADFTLVDSGTFWLSETPEWESVGWDGRSRNICTWAHLKSNQSGDEFVVMNTQLDAYGTTARARGASLIVEKAAEFGLPVIFAGDFQAEASDDSYRNITESAFSDTALIASETGLTGPTVNGAFGNDERFDTQSEFIFTSFGDFAVERFTLLDDKVDDKYVSCHYALFAELALLSV